MINKKTGVEPNDSDEIENISGIAGDEPSSTDLSTKSPASIKAYVVSSKPKQDQAREQHLEELKARVAKGEYHPAPEDVAESILKSIIEEN